MELVHLLLTRRRAVWRVRVFFRGAILWKSYRVAEYPTPDDVLRRVIEGLSLPKLAQLVDDQRQSDNKPTHDHDDAHPGHDIQRNFTHRRLQIAIVQAWGWLS